MSELGIRIGLPMGGVSTLSSQGAPRARGQVADGRQRHDDGPLTMGRGGELDCHYCRLLKPAPPSSRKSQHQTQTDGGNLAGPHDDPARQVSRIVGPRWATPNPFGHGRLLGG
jgi:hypothetical protein